MWTEQDDFDGIQHLVVLKKEDWQRFRSELLPLAHLSQDTLEKIQQLLTPKRRKKPIERSQCLRLIEVIMSHAPLQYKHSEEASTEWIYNFYAAHGQRIRKELTEIERISDLQSKGVCTHSSNVVHRRQLRRVMCSNRSGMYMITRAYLSY